MFFVKNQKDGARGEYCGRPSPLGNPFYMKTEKDRNAVCEQYADWFTDKVFEDNSAVMTELRRLWKVHQREGEVNLLCYCAPKRCHCDTIASFLNSYL